MIFLLGVLSTAKESNPVMSALAYVSTINFYTVQVVVAMETFPHVENAFVMASIKDMDGEVAFKPNNEGIVNVCLVRSFYTPVIWRTYYGMALSVRRAVRPSVCSVVHNPCGQDIARTIWLRMLKLSVYTLFEQR